MVDGKRDIHIIIFFNLSKKEAREDRIAKKVPYIAAWFGDTPFEHPFSHNTPFG